VLISRREVVCVVCLLSLLAAGPVLAQSVAGAPPPAPQEGASPESIQPLAAAPDLIDGIPRRTVEAVRLGDGERITLDGVFDEPVWRRATPATQFVQIDPQNGRPATEETEVRMVFSKEAFYIGVTAFDSEPDKWLGFQRRRDEFLSSDDRFMWRIDTFLDERSGYFFEMNPSGLMADAVFGINGMNRAWDGIWNARVKHTDFGWTIEIMIPFRTLNFDPNNDTWGINFQRTVRRKNEDSIWMGWGRNQGLGRMTNAGHVSGISNVTQGHGLDIKPYGLVSTDQAPGRASGAWQRDANAGLDLFYNPTSGLKANLTINTDFAQTEVDQRQVNLTRFSLFFPERRDFFLDGATFFDFGSNSDGGEQVQPFFSRRVGLSANATPQRIDYGTKFNGQIGAQDVGFMHVRTGDDDDLSLAGEEFTAARVKRRMFQQSYVGGLFTRRDARGDLAGASHTAGLDFQFGTPRFRGNQNLNLAGWWLTEQRPGVTSGNSAFGLSLDYPNDRWAWGVGAREVQQNFDPSVGFVARRNYRRYNQFLNYGYRPRNPRVLRRAQVSGNLTILTDLRNEMIERNVGFTPVNVQLQSQDNFNVDVDNNYIRLDAPFRISPAITLPMGNAYTFTRVAFNGQTANRRMLAVNARFETGDFYSGTRHQTSMGLTVRARPGYIFSINHEWNTIDLAEGQFTTNLVRLVTDSQFSPFIALVNNVQYDSVSRVLGWQSRFRWILTPGNDLYVVYTHNWLQDPVGDRFASLDRRLASKVLYTHRF
jgi:hypothetical protein